MCSSDLGIDDVRRLKESVGYAPMDSRYKIFIIDEAHMLSREAFNALLKTLEEPPARVTFIMATTEPHKFPATIISRCQHFVLKPLPESGLLAHLSQVLNAEGIAFDESALRLIARRGAGSVRDSMSLLGQVLALGEGRLTETSVRSVLGLAGREAFIALLQAVKSGDSVALSALLRGMLEQGLDMGFFLRELASLWRAMFMLRQSGERALGVIDVPENEARRYLEMSHNFSLQHIHACWQMTLEAQRRVLTSLEPALALELLLLNIGMLPQLLSLEHLSAMNRKAGVKPSSSGASGGAPGEERTPGLGGNAPGSTVLDTPAAETLQQYDSAPAVAAVPGAPCIQPEPDWNSIFALCEAKKLSSGFVALLKRINARWEHGELRLEASDDFTLKRLHDPQIRTRLEELLADWRGAVPTFAIVAQKTVVKSRDDLKAEVMQHPFVRAVRESFGGHVIDYGQLR